MKPIRSLIWSWRKEILSLFNRLIIIATGSSRVQMNPNVKDAINTRNYRSFVDAKKLLTVPKTARKRIKGII